MNKLQDTLLSAIYRHIFIRIYTELINNLNKERKLNVIINIKELYVLHIHNESTYFTCYLTVR